jgi:hypothetical protein
LNLEPPTLGKGYATMRQTTKIAAQSPEKVSCRSVRREASLDQEPDPEVLAFRAAFDGRSPLDDLVRQGARQMLQAALESEVQMFLNEHTHKVDDQGRRLVVRNGSLPARQILTGAGPLEVTQPRVRDKSPSLPRESGSVRRFCRSICGSRSRSRN